MSFKDPEKEREYMRMYHLKNKELIQAQRKGFREDNKERLSKTYKEYYLLNKESLTTSAKNYYKNNKESCKKRNKEYKKKIRSIKPSLCPSYNITLAERNRDAWLKEELTVYKIRLTNKTESFLKIGVTVNINDRIKRFPYKVEIIKLLTIDKYEAIYFEQSLIKNKTKYIPKKSFHGYTECFVE